MYLQINQLNKTIKSKPVLRNINAGFEQGRIYGVVGVNGSGKTMLLRAICGFIRPNSGTVTIGGKTVEFNRKLPESVGVIIENPGFVLNETGVQNLRYLADINHAYDPAETKRLMTIFDLYEQANEKVKAYSLGMRQKLAIVQAFMEHQNLVLLDEPTNGLDESSVGVFLDEMKRQREQGKTIIIASHHRDELEQIADQFYHMNDGKLTQSNGSD